MPRIPLVTLVLVALNLAVYGLELGTGGQGLCNAYGFVPAHPSLETAVSSLFLHDPSSLLHLGGNLVFLVIFGSIVEGELGGFWFIALYAAAGLGGAVLHAVVNPSSTDALVGASGAIFGVLSIAGALRPRLLGFVAAFGCVEIWHAFMGGNGVTSFGCHLGGLAVGALVVVFMRVTGSEALEAA